MRLGFTCGMERVKKKKVVESVALVRGKDGRLFLKAKEKIHISRGIFTH